MAWEGTLSEFKVSHGDDPKVVKEAATENYLLYPAPLSWRSSRWLLAVA